MLKDEKNRVIGKIVNVSADSLTIELHGGSDNFTVVGFDNIHYIATLGSYLLVPMQSDYVVLEVIGISEKDNAQHGVSQGELDKISSAKFLRTIPLGSIDLKRSSFRFGVSIYPSLYADVMYARDEDLDCIFNIRKPNDIDNTKADDSEEVPYTLEIGTSAVFGNYPVKVKIDELFGGHIAVLGNTGSGKSCTIASIMQSIYMKDRPYLAHGSSVIIFDVNGEYRKSFDKIPSDIRTLYLEFEENKVCEKVSGELRDGEVCNKFTLPHWFMSFEEWELLLRASEKSQVPALRIALGFASLFYKSGEADESDSVAKIREHIFAKILLSAFRGSDTTPTKVDRIFTLYHNVKGDNFFITRSEIDEAIRTHFGQIENKDAAKDVMDKLEEKIMEEFSLPVYDNSKFSFENLQDALDLALYYEESNGNKHIRDYCSSLVTRLKSITNHPDYDVFRVNPDISEGYNPESNLNSYVDYIIGISRKDKGSPVYRKDRQICIIDLNNAPDEIIQIASAVISRLIFDRLRRASPRSGLPVHLVLEEAHRYISEKPSKYAIDAGEVFNRVSKEGRKYGLFLMVASQRPSELSKTVLSQCNNFIVHRIQNPDDLSQIRQMTPFISDSILGRLASLPKQHALIFGNSVNIPMTFRVRDASPEPYSSDARIREIWYVEENKDIPFST